MDLMSRLAELGPFLPGTLETRRRVLKKSSRRSRCKDEGVYHVLSYSVKGRNSSMYVKSADYAAVAKMVSNYNEARGLIVELGLEMVSSCRKHGVEEAVAAWRARAEGIDVESPC